MVENQCVNLYQSHRFATGNVLKVNGFGIGSEWFKWQNSTSSIQIISSGLLEDWPVWL